MLNSWYQPVEILIQLVQMGFPDSAFPESSPDDFTEQIGF